MSWKNPHWDLTVGDGRWLRYPLQRQISNQTWDIKYYGTENHLNHYCKVILERDKALWKHSGQLLGCLHKWAHSPQETMSKQHSEAVFSQMPFVFTWNILFFLIWGSFSLRLFLIGTVSHVPCFYDTFGGDWLGDCLSDWVCWDFPAE